MAGRRAGTTLLALLLLARDDGLEVLALPALLLRVAIGNVGDVSDLLGLVDGRFLDVGPVHLAAKAAATVGEAVGGCGRSGAQKRWRLRLALLRRSTRCGLMAMMTADRPMLAGRSWNRCVRPEGRGRVAGLRASACCQVNGSGTRILPSLWCEERMEVRGASAAKQGIGRWRGHTRSMRSMR